MAVATDHLRVERWFDSKFAQLQESSPVQRFALGARRHTHSKNAAIM